mgnify:CR=1 FL=1
MALIKCPECENMVSDKSEKCIHCGYPMESSIAEIEYSIVMDGYMDTDNYAVAMLKQYLGIPYEEGFEIVSRLPYVLDSSSDLLKMKNLANTLSNEKVVVRLIDNNNKEYSFSDGLIIDSGTGMFVNVPKCPTCQSTKVLKISMSSKVFSGIAIGLFSSKIRNTFECKNCGYKW